MPLNFNTQQYVPEILQTVVDRLKDIASRQNNFIHSPNINHVELCLIQEDKLDIITLLLTSIVFELIETFLEPEELTRANRWFSLSCSNLTSNTKEMKFIKVETMMIFQVEHYIMFQGHLIRETTKRSRRV